MKKSRIVRRAMICSGILVSGLALLLCLLWAIDPFAVATPTPMEPALLADADTTTLAAGALNMMPLPGTALTLMETEQITQWRATNAHHAARLAEWLTPLDAATIQAADSQSSVEPYLLQEYAAQCKAYMGSVPAFSCTELTEANNVESAKVVEVNRATSECPLLGVDPGKDVGVDEECNLNGSVEGQLKPPGDAPDDAEVSILFSCRRYDDETKAGYFDDIAVIQHDEASGNTCWFQSPTVLAFNKQGNLQHDEYGNFQFADLNGTAVPSPMAYGAQNFWLHPYHPEDELGPDDIGDMRAGRRDVVSAMNCQRCHDADPFVWTPFVSNTHRLSGDPTPIDGWNPTGKYVANFQGIFNADGNARRQPHVFQPTQDGSPNQCVTCHRLGENTMTEFPAAPSPTFTAPSAYGGVVVHLLDHILRDMNATDGNGTRWMPPFNATGDLSESITTTTERILRACAADPMATALSVDGQTIDCSGGSSSNIIDGLPGPKQRPNLQVTVESSPARLVSGAAVEYTIHLRNRAVYTAVDSATGISVITSLPVGVALSVAPTDCTQSTNNEQTTVTCTVDDLASGEATDLTLVGMVGAATHERAITNTVQVKTSATDDNVETIQVETVHTVMRKADLTIDQQATVLPGGANTAGQMQIQYAMTVHNHGPAAVDEVTIVQILPVGAIYEVGLSNPRCTQDTGRVRCSLGQLQNGHTSTVHVVASAANTAGYFLASSATVESAAPDDILGNNQATSALFDPGQVHQSYLPYVAMERRSGPDLIIKTIEVTDGSAAVVIQNIGETAIAPDETFWVDLYINPAVPPTRVNETVQDRESDGIVWGVISPTLPLEPGAAYTLQIGDNYFVPNRSSIPREIEAGSVIYAQVDSANLDSQWGGVVESHEQNARSYNNIAAITVEERISTTEWPRKTNSDQVLRAAHTARAE